VDLEAASVAKGCNVEESDWRKSSCLHHAASHGSLGILVILLQADADVAAKNLAGNSSKLCFCKNNKRRIISRGASKEQLNFVSARTIKRHHHHTIEVLKAGDARNPRSGQGRYPVSVRQIELHWRGSYHSPGCSECESQKIDVGDCPSRRCQ